VINPETGILSFEQPPILIGPALTRMEFLAGTLSENAADWMVNEPWHSWKLAGQYVSSSTPFVVLLFFQAEHLKMVDLLHDDPAFGRSWNDHSRAKELARQASHNQWLSKCLGTRRDFAWGSVWSRYDERAGDSSISIRYR
jgi:hypothetical protein